jgi:HK97 gp10 family phage protein
MDVKVTVDFGNIPEKLRDLGPKLARKALRRAVGKVGDMWVAEAKSRVPVESGDLRESIDKKISTSKKGNNLSATVSVGPTYNTKSRKPGDSSQQPGTYGLFVELGTKSMRPVPFLRPMFDATGDKAIEILADTLREDLNETVKSS